MRNLAGYPRSAAAGAAAALAVVAAVGTAQAITDTVFKYSTPKTGFFTIDAMALAPDGSNSLNFSNTWLSGLSPAAGNVRCFNAGVNLPNGATITQLSVWYKRAAGSVTVHLIRKKLADGEGNFLATASLSDSANTRKVEHFQIDAADAVVNNNLYSYGLGLCPFAQPDSTYYSARVAYTYTNAGD
jgi:hypothetical protein